MMFRLVVSALSIMLIAPNIAEAQDYKLGAIGIDQPWARVTIASRPAAGYMTIINEGGEPDRLLSAASPKADRVELHTHTMKDGVMKMAPAGIIDIPANGRVEFAPGGLHLMIFGLKEVPKPGESLPITVNFERSGSIDLEFEVGEPGKGASAPAMDHSSHGSAKP